MFDCTVCTYIYFIILYNTMGVSPERYEINTRDINVYIPNKTKTDIWTSIWLSLLKRVPDCLLEVSRQIPPEGPATCQNCQCDLARF